ncbi:MAG TPA: sigma 54-interacting transcriptional regulator [Pyrinomonadaceae bacterium]|nr:sigma 54-interacting transcriptional regulator [Pyrinomonadaceae bacterium]
MSKEGQYSDNPVVDLAHARAKLRSRGRKGSPTSSADELEAINLLLDKGHSVEARTRLDSLISAARNDPALLAGARLALSLVLEMHGERHESLQAVAMYEAEEERAKLDPMLSLRLRVQTSLAYNYSGDHPKAITLLKTALRDLEEQGTNLDAGIVYAALARVYRSINEYQIARDYSQRALESYRLSGDWRGLAEAYFGIATSDYQETRNESALENYEHALKLVGDHPATFLLGKIYANMAGVCWFLKRSQEGIQYLEKAIGYYERTDHKINAALGYNNLGMNLILVGQWDRAQEALNRALAFLTEVNERDDKVPMALDSLGELAMLRGDLDEARGYLERAVAMAAENGNKWYECQALRTLARCLSAMKSSADARATAERALEMAQRIGDRQAICESELLLAESHLQVGDLDYCASALEKIAEQTSDSAADMVLAGEAQRLRGLLALAQSDAPLAAQHFGRCVSIFDLLGDRYRSARSHHDLGRAYALAQPELAAEHLTRAVNVFRELGARLDLESAEVDLAEHDQSAPQQQRRGEAVLQLVTLRLAEAVASRALLLRELAAVIRQETSAQRVVILEPDEEQRNRVVVAQGCDGAEATAIADEFSSLETDTARERFAKKHDAAVIALRSSNSLPATLLISPRDAALPAGGLALEPLLRVVELGMDVCALRARAPASQSTQEEGGIAGASLLPGFIHSSPAMTRLVEEVHKIRSSDVTVLVTGESGTGKELVARAIHALSSRRKKIFVPFNCTAVPKELSEAYLFGHVRGAFTGAVSDSPGVIRTAAGGTLFIDEVGDLPLDLQPKLLRFLQEGEIQPLGERKPIQVDVRIIAATNTDLETMVEQGRFREDLYYRLNVIRLRVPPLRERRSEVPSIVNYYINHYSAKFGRHNIQITPQAVDLLMVGDWPGNVRELCNEIQRVVARTENDRWITPEDLSPELRRVGVPAMPPSSVAVLGTTNTGRSEIVPLKNVTLADALSEVERRMISEALRKHKGNISRAARELGLTRRGLYLKLERYEMNPGAANGTTDF